MKLTEEQRIERAHVSLIRDPEYTMVSGIIMYGKSTVVDTPGITARTDGIDVDYGRAFITDLTDNELRALILHEKMHCAFKHMTVWKNLYKDNPTIANMACDFVINLPIKDRERADGFVVLPKGGCVDEKYRGMDAGQVYRALMADPQYQDMQGTGSKGLGFDEHDWDKIDGMSEEEIDQLSKQIDQTLRQGGIMASKSGASVDRNLIEMLKPKVNWKDALREFVTNSKPGDDYSTYRRIDRRFQSQNLMLPTLYSDKVFRITIGIDTSGSIGDDILSEFLAEVQGVCESVSPEIIDIMYWDTRVASHELYEGHAINTIRESTKPSGGGGTDPTCMAEYVQEKNIKPDCIIMLTDGEIYGDWGVWDVPILWCIDNDHITAGVGTTVHM